MESSNEVKKAGERRTAGRIRPWETVREGAVEPRRIMAFQEVERRSPRTERVGTYEVLRLQPWVNVVALTQEDEIVLVEQYRHGIDAITLEIPGGLVDPGEDPMLAAARELLEETGYAGGEPELLGRVYPNPAIQDNVCSSYLVRDARPVAPPQLDPGEDIAVVTVSRGELPELLRRGRIRHSLVLSAFHWLGLAESGFPWVEEP
jgi:8-oxo-dGTP pyrophosphatase MutT (NUDIX family)